MPPIVLKSPAKLNLVLDLLRKRADGYHDVEFVMQELEIHDTITIESTMKNTEIILACTDPSVPLDEKNTCYKAAQLMQEECLKQKLPVQGVSIHIEKKIPSAGGLGGGSSNAAAVLKGLNQLWELQLSIEQLCELAARIGSDVSFFIFGGTCMAEGRGERITPIEKCPLLHLAFISLPIVLPDDAEKVKKQEQWLREHFLPEIENKGKPLLCLSNELESVKVDKTKWVYAHFDVAKAKNHPSVNEMQKAIARNDSLAVAQAMGNIFEDNVNIPQYNPIFYLIESLKTMPGVRNAILAGAGPTICAVCDSAKTAETIIAPFKAKNMAAFTTRTT